MQAAAVPPVKPLRLIVEVDHAQLGAIVSQLVTLASAALTPRAHPTTPPAPAPADDTDDPASRLAPEHDPPLPVARRPRVAARGGQQAPVPVARPGPRSGVTLPPELRKYKLGRLCPKPGHEYAHSGQSLKRGTHCVLCERERQHARKRAPVPVTVLPPGTPGPRPELPPHLALNAFLSPITCTDESHRYREHEAWTLRYTRDETCVMCVTQQSQTALAGD